MAQRVLVLDKDQDFVRELERGFGQLGAEVEVVRDADASIARARAGDVALVLLGMDAMSTPGEAFLVCKRFKSDDELASIPFVIMGGPQHAESFESHKKLKKRRADEYVSLPISFDDLLAQVGELAGLGPEDGASPVSEAPIEPLDAEMNVPDEDIEAFAESAFGELMREDEPPVVRSASVPAPPRRSNRPQAGRVSEPASAAAPALPRPAATTLGADSGARPEPGARSAEPARVVSERTAEATERRVQELEARLQEASARAELAERRSRASVPAPAVGVSSRDYLDLREQLNRKDKELLALRDEISQRDRQLLEHNDRSLQLERAQAELHDALQGSQRQLEDAQAKVRTYEAERDSAGRRLEELRARLTRAEERAKQLEAEHERALSELRVSQAQALDERDRAAVAALEQARGESAARAAELEERARVALAEADAQRESELQALRTAGMVALDEARSEAAQERARALEALSNERARELERSLSEAERAREAALAGLERELEAKHDAVRRELVERHGSELDTLARKLDEAETRGAAQGDRIAQLEQLERELQSRIDALQAELTRRTEERDTALNELSAMRASIDSLERTGARLADRLATLESELARAHEHIDEQSAKIALDQEILERVRRALGIGIGLLEQQRQNVV